MIELAIYDMDRTITRSGTYTPFLIHSALRLAPWRLMLIPAALILMLAYVAKLIDRATLKECNQALLLGRRVDPARLAPIFESFAKKITAAHLHPGALEAIAADRAAGRRLVMATASYQIYVDAIARALGFDDVIATKSVIGPDGAILAQIDGENCYGPAKLRMIQAWMVVENLSRTQCNIRFYSDHVSDQYVLEWADEPYPVNAHKRLRVMANQRGWELSDWSK